MRKEVGTIPRRLNARNGFEAQSLIHDSSKDLTMTRFEVIQKY